MIPTCFTLQVRLADIFGDNGMISVIICRHGEPGLWEIDTWLMSCRVLGRGVEPMVLREILAEARARGIDTLLGVYRPTTRNGMVSDHYKKLGFDAVRTNFRRSNLVAAGHGHNFGTGVGPDAGASPRQCVRAKRAGRVTVEQERLPRRDWIILPLLSILSLGLLLGLSEVGARIFGRSTWRIAVRSRTQPSVCGSSQTVSRRSRARKHRGWTTAITRAASVSRFVRPQAGSWLPGGGDRLVDQQRLPGSVCRDLLARTTALLQQHCHVPV